MAHPIGRSPNILKAAVRRSNEERMARLEGEDLNALFDTLADWNVQLKDIQDFIHSDEPGGPQP